jgi:alpha-glucosidase
MSMTTRWWQGAVGYQVYVRSFADADGDGVGDLPGLRRRLPYLADLGVDVVWITPFYPSPQADHGYDISDHLGVDPTFGDLDDVQGILADAHALGLKVLIDLVPNHVSDQHPWFADALTGRDARHRDRFVWRDGDGPDRPPNNWVSHFGGPAWTYHPPTEQWWMHLFLPEQPDLNWRDPQVRAEFERIVTTWLDRGVDGFRIDVAHSLIEDAEFRDNPVLVPTLSPDAPPAEVFDAFEHAHDLDQPEVLDIYRTWNRIAAAHDAVLVGEVYLLDQDQVARYVRDQDALHLSFYFPALKVGWDADAIREVLRRGAEVGGAGFAWPLSSHDDPHAATRFGGGELGARRAAAYLAVLCALPGVPFLYQGDELGLDDGLIDTSADPMAVRNPTSHSRDGSRTPVPWAPGPGFGFTTGTPWLPFGRNRSDERTAAAQEGDPRSPLERTRALLAVRRELADLRTGPAPTWLTDEGPIVAFRRGGVVVVAHVATPGDDSRTWEVPGGAAVTLRHATADGVTLEGGTLRLPPDCTAYLTVSGGGA